MVQTLSFPLNLYHLVSSIQLHLWLRQNSVQFKNMYYWVNVNILLQMGFYTYKIQYHWILCIIYSLIWEKPNKILGPAYTNNICCKFYFKTPNIKTNLWKLCNMIVLLLWHSYWNLSIFWLWCNILQSMTLPTAVSLSSGKTGKKPTMLGPLDKADLHPQAWKQSIWLNIYENLQVPTGR
jgi:hypothetical protein